MDSESFPTRCYICQSEIGPNSHAILQTCTCLVAKCFQCATLQLSISIPPYDNILCQMCGYKMDKDSGVIKNTDKAKLVEEKLLIRGAEFFEFTLPRRTSDTKRLEPLLDKYVEIGYSDIVSSLWHEFQSKDLAMLRLFIARLETLRGGPLEDHKRISDQPPEVLLPAVLGANPTDLPNGPLHYISFSRNIVLEKLLQNEPIDRTCTICCDPVHPGQTVLFPCECAIIMCHTCMLNAITNNPNTYKDGIKCPTCRIDSKVSYGKTKVMETQESSLIQKVKKFIQEVAPGTPTTMTEKNVSLMIGFYVSLGLAPKYFNFDQSDSTLTKAKGRLILARLEHYRCIGEKHDELPLGPLNSLEVRSNPFLDFYLRNTKRIDEDASVEYDWKIFRTQIMTSVQDFQLRSQQVILPPIDNKSSGNNALQNDKEEGEILDIDEEDDNFKKFKEFLPLQQLDQCPFCHVNPFNIYYMKSHLRSFHGKRSEVDEAIAKFEKLEIALQKEMKQNQQEIVIDMIKEESDASLESTSDDEIELVYTNKNKPGLSLEAAKKKVEENEIEIIQHSCKPFRKPKKLISEEKIVPATPAGVDHYVLKEEGKNDSTMVPIPPSHHDGTKNSTSSLYHNQAVMKEANLNNEAASKFLTDMKRSLLRGTTTASSSNVSPAVTPHVLSQKLERIEAETSLEKSGERVESSRQQHGPKRMYNPATGESYTVFSPSRSAEASNIPSRASTPLCGGTSSLSLEEYQRRQSELAPVLGILRNFRFEDQYELVINPPIMHINRRLNRHHPIFIGSYVLNFRITFGEHDRARMQNIVEITNPNELVGMLQMFTNRTPLNVVKQALRSQYGFFGNICQYRREGGHLIKQDLTFAQFEMPEGSMVSIRPLQPILDHHDPKRKVYRRKNHHRLTHLQLAKVYAEIRRKSAIAKLMYNDLRKQQQEAYAESKRLEAEEDTLYRAMLQESGEDDEDLINEDGKEKEKTLTLNNDEEEDDDGMYSPYTDTNTPRPENTFLVPITKYEEEILEATDDEDDLKMMTKKKRKELQKPKPIGSRSSSMPTSPAPSSIYVKEEIVVKKEKGAPDVPKAATIPPKEEEEEEAKLDPLESVTWYFSRDGTEELEKVVEATPGRRLPSFPTTITKRPNPPPPPPQPTQSHSSNPETNTYRYSTHEQITVTTKPVTHNRPMDSYERALLNSDSDDDSDAPQKKKAKKPTTNNAASNRNSHNHNNRAASLSKYGAGIHPTDRVGKPFVSRGSGSDYGNNPAHSSSSYNSNNYSARRDDRDDPRGYSSSGRGYSDGGRSHTDWQRGRGDADSRYGRDNSYGRPPPPPRR